MESAITNVIVEILFKTIKLSSALSKRGVCFLFTISAQEMELIPWIENLNFGCGLFGLKVIVIIVMKWDWYEPFSIQHSIRKVIKMIKWILRLYAVQLLIWWFFSFGGWGGTNNNGCKYYKECEIKLEDTKQWIK